MRGNEALSDIAYFFAKGAVCGTRYGLYIVYFWITHFWIIA